MNQAEMIVTATLLMKIENYSVVVKHMKKSENLWRVTGTTRVRTSVSGNK